MPEFAQGSPSSKKHTARERVEARREAAMNVGSGQAHGIGGPIYMDESGVGHKRLPAKVPRAQQAPDVLHMDSFGVGHKAPDIRNNNVMVGMPANGVVVPDHSTPGTFAPADDRLNTMLFGSSRTDDGSGPVNAPMKPGSVFELDQSGDLLDGHASEVDASGVTHSYDTQLPSVYSSGGGFKQASKAASIEEASDGHSLMRTSLLKSTDTLIDAQTRASAEPAPGHEKERPELALNWGQHDPIIDQPTLEERITKGAMRYANPNGATAPRSSKFSSYEAYNDSFEMGSDKLMSGVSNGSIAIGPGQNSVKITQDQGKTSGVSVGKAGTKSKGPVPNYFSAVTSSKTKDQYSATSAPQPLDHSMIGFNVDSSGESSMAQHFPAPSGASVQGSHFAPNGPGPSLGTAVRDPRDVVRERLTQKAELHNGGPLQVNPYSEMFPDKGT